VKRYGEGKVMPIEVVTGSSVFKSRNKLAKYPDPSKDPERYIPYPTVGHQPSFQIKASDKIFTIGSCFARNTERALVAMGMPVLSALVEGVTPDENITNKYTTKSILHDLRTTFAYPSRAKSTIYEQSADAFVNLTFGGTGALTPKPLAEVEDLTDRYFANLKKIRSANIIILTLGLVEVWYDKLTKTYLNLMPNVRILKKQPERFEMHVLSYEDIMGDLQEILAILRANAQPDVRFLLTVSPVPLHATFRDQDCMQANMYSKSVQRTAAEVICLSNPDVAYFPSYEMVSMAAPQYAWVDVDFRHVRKEMVDRIMRSVLSHYLEPGVIPPAKEEFQRLLKQREYDQVIELIDAHLNAKGIDLADASVQVQYYYARAHAALGKTDAALKAVRYVTERMPRHEQARILQKELEARTTG
jgi:GSCFA family